MALLSIVRLPCFIFDKHQEIIGIRFIDFLVKIGEKREKVKDPSLVSLGE
jgi:hypothetical protein